MSLFKARESWRARLSGSTGEAEEFDRGGLCTGNVDNDATGVTKLVVGSLQGVLRVYAPSANGGKLDDLLLESNVGSAILQVEIGEFNASSVNTLAVLFPRNLCVYSVRRAAGGVFFTLDKAFEHSLDHTAANMAIGKMGGSARDAICVQSFDGELRVFEQETAALRRYLRNFLVPGPLCYVPTSDSLATCSSSFVLEAYSYAGLVSSSADGRSADAHETQLTQQKKVRPEWSINLGQPALEIACGQVTAGADGSICDVVALCQDTLYVITDAGTLRWQRRLSFEPSCLTLYQLPPLSFSNTKSQNHAQQRPPQNMLIGTSTGSLMIFSGKALQWSAKCTEPPIATRVGSFAGQRGHIAALSEDGSLSLNYLGTDPPLSAVANFESKELNYEELDEEHRRLLSIIREATTEHGKEPADVIHLMPSEPQMLGRGSETSSIDQPLTAIVTASVEYAGEDTLSSVHITAGVPAPLVCMQDSFVVEELPGFSSEAVEMDIELYSGSDTLPSSDEISIVASCVTPAGEPRTANVRVQLPLGCFCKQVQPVKASAHRITLDMNKQPPQVAALFEDVSQPHVQAGNVLSLEFPTGDVCVIVTSKNGTRARVQSSNVQAMWLVLKEFRRRLEVYFAHSTEPLSIGVAEEIPLQAVYDAIDEHFKLRTRKQELENKLEQRAHQLRAVQKRLLVRYKDKNPSSLEHLMTLLQGTHTQLCDLDDQLRECKNQLAHARRALACTLQLALQVAYLRYDLSEDEARVLRAHLSPHVADSDDGQGWEELTEQATSHLLRSTMEQHEQSENSKMGEQSVLAAATAASTPMAKQRGEETIVESTKQLKQNIRLVFSLFNRGSRSQQHRLNR